MLRPSDGVQGVKDFVRKVVEDAGPNPCPPIVVGVQPLVGRVPGRVDHAGDEAAVPGLQLPGLLPAQGGLDGYRHIRAPPSYVWSRGS